MADIILKESDRNCLCGILDTLSRDAAPEAEAIRLQITAVLAADSITPEEIRHLAELLNARRRDIRSAVFQKSPVEACSHVSADDTCENPEHRIFLPNRIMLQHQAAQLAAALVFLQQLEPNARIRRGHGRSN